MEEAATENHQRIRIIIVANQALLRHAMTALLGANPALTVVAEARDGQEALALVAQLRADLVISGAVPAHGPAELARRIRDELGLDTPVVVLTSHDDPSLVMEAVRSPVAGYLHADVETDAFVTALKAILCGFTVLGRQARAAFADLAWRPGVIARATTTAELTSREREVLQSMAEGMTNKEIATRLGVGVRTIELHVSNIIRKLGVQTRTEAVITVLRGAVGDRG